MREIKFRAWEKSLNEIIPVHNIDFKEKQINTNGAWRMFDEIELMQYTGLKNKNGIEIYELDYAEKDDKIYLVFWLKNRYILKDISEDDIIELDNNIKVRSNYYENTEKITPKYGILQENS